MKKLLMAAIAAMMSLAAYADGELGLYILAGSTDTYPVSELQKITFSNGNVVVHKTDGTTSSTAMSGIQRMYFGEITPDGINTLASDEAYAWDGSDAGQLIGRITYADTRKGSYRLEYLDDASPSASFIYCEFLGKSLRAFVGESSHDRLTSGFTKHLQDMLRACALDNTRFRGRSYTYSGEEVAREYTDKLANPQAQPVGRTLLATLPMMVLGALLMYVLRVGLWPGVLAVVGSIALLLVLPIAAGTLVLSGINKAEATRTVRAALDAGRLPSAGQHNARFSVRQDCTLYCDEARELRGDRSYEVTVTGHYLLYHMHDGVLAPIPKSAL